MLKRLFRPQKSQEPIRFGVIACQTGSMASYARTSLQGLDLGLEYATEGTRQVAGRTLELVVKDDAGDPDLGEQFARDLVRDGQADIILGCTSSAVAIKVSQVARELDRVFMAAVAATDVLTGEWFNRYTFRTVANTSQDAAAGGIYAAEHLGKTFYFIAPDSIWGQQSRSAWWRVIMKYHGDIVGDIMAPPNGRNFSLFLREIASRSPDVLVVSWAGDTTRLLLKQVREAGLFDNCKVTGGMTDHENIVALGNAIAGMVCSSKYYYEFPKNPVNDWLVARHQERYGEPPDIFTESGFSAGLALVTALKRTGGKPVADGLIPVLEGMSFTAPKGQYTFRREDHQALQPMYITELVMDPARGHCVPRLIREISAEDAAPPIVKPR